MSKTAEIVLGSSNPASVKNLVYFSDFNEGLPQEQVDKTDNFLETVENYLGVKTKRIVLEESWSMNNPGDANGAGLQEYIGEVSKPTIPFL